MITAEEARKMTNAHKYTTQDIYNMIAASARKLNNRIQVIKYDLKTPEETIKELRENGYEVNFLSAIYTITW